MWKRWTPGYCWWPARQALKTRQIRRGSWVKRQISLEWAPVKPGGKVMRNYDRPMLLVLAVMAASSLGFYAHRVIVSDDWSDPIMFVGSFVILAGIIEKLIRNFRDAPIEE
jgi:hypothetical protein